MATLCVAALFLDQEGARLLPGWNMPKVSLLTFALGAAWLGLFFVHRLRAMQQQVDVLTDRLERVTRRTEAMEDETRRRRSLPL
jgi:predicted ATP-dependent Lon-type protease